MDDETVFETIIQELKVKAQCTGVASAMKYVHMRRRVTEWWLTGSTDNGKPTLSQLEALLPSENKNVRAALQAWSDLSPYQR
jgi:hypothetical protein